MCILNLVPCPLFQFLWNMQPEFTQWIISLMANAIRRNKMPWLSPSHSGAIHQPCKIQPVQYCTFHKVFWILKSYHMWCRYKCHQKYVCIAKLVPYMWYDYCDSNTMLCILCGNTPHCPHHKWCRLKCHQKYVCIVNVVPCQLLKLLWKLCLHSESCPMSTISIPFEICNLNLGSESSILSQMA